MGLNTGLVVVGSIGDNLRMDYTAVGDTTNLAARLQQLAAPETILVSAATGRLAQGGVPGGPPAGAGQRQGRPDSRLQGARPRTPPAPGRR